MLKSNVETKMMMSKAKINCSECKDEFTPTKNNHEFCSGRCRSANFRRIQREKMDFAERVIANLTEPQNGKRVKVDLFA